MQQASDERPDVTREEIIDPEIAICDPHHHLWYESDARYHLNDFLKDVTSGHNVVKSIFIESRLMLDKSAPTALQPVGETEFVKRTVAQVRDRTGIDIAAGIVGFADLTLGGRVNPVLESHIIKSDNKFRGVRHTCAWDADPTFKSRHNAARGLLSDNKFREGFACLEKYQLNFDAWLFHPQLPELADLAKNYPETKIIINHTGGLLGIGPYTENRSGVIADWRKSIAALAKLPNVYIKLGGLGMSICGFGWSKRSIPPTSEELGKHMAPLYLYCIEKFGVARCMFESNFPVDKSSYSYSALWNAFKRIVQKFSLSEKCALFHDTAVEVYHI